MSSVGFALGSNQGDRLRYLEQAGALLESRLALEHVRYSSVYVTPALLPEGAPEAWNIPYLNQVMLAEVPGEAEPMVLLEQVKQMEQQLGRQVRGHWGPREIDIDILFIDEVCMQTEALTLPHAAMAERAFVMVPLAEIAPEWRHPVLQQSAVELAAHCAAEGMELYAD